MALVKHMTHNVTTAYRYYDKSLDDIQTNIMVSTKLVVTRYIHVGDGNVDYGMSYFLSN
jgi:hypothetical protein